MPSKNTSILSARVKDESVKRLENAASAAGFSVPNLLNMFADSLYRGDIYIDGNVIKGVTPNEIDLSRLEEVAKRYKKTPQAVLDMMLDRSVGG